MKCPNCENEMLHTQISNNDYYVCQKCRKVHKVENAPVLSARNNAVDRILGVLLGIVVTIAILLMGTLAVIGITGMEEAQPQGETTIATSSRPVSRSELIKEGKLKKALSSGGFAKTPPSQQNGIPENPQEPQVTAQAPQETELPQQNTSMQQQSTTPAQSQTQDSAPSRQLQDSIPPQQPQEQMVWVTKSGSKYHNKNNCGNTDSAAAHQEPLSQAQQKGLEPCKNCYN